MYTHIHIPGAWYMDTTAQEKYVIPAVLRKAQEGSSFAELAAGFGLTAAPPAAAEGMRGDCIQLPQPSPPAIQERTAANLWKTILQGHGCTLEPANPQSSRLVLLQKQHHRLTGHNFPCTMQLSSCSREFQFLSCFLIFFFLPLQLQQGCWLSYSACVSVAGSWDGAGEQKLLSQGFTPLLQHTAGARLSTGQGERSAAVMKQHLKAGLFHSEIMTALTCFAGILALCQAGESSDGELPNPPNIKGNEAVPMGFVCSLATKMLHQSFPLKSRAARCSGIPSSPSAGPAASAKQGLIFSAVQTTMSQSDCEKSLTNIIGMNKRRGKNS